MMTRLLSCLVSLAMLALLAACAGNPASPPIQSESAIRESLAGENPHSLVGYWFVIVDTQERSVEVVPVRTTAMHLNVTGVLNVTMGVSAKGAPGGDPPNGLFSLDVTLKHPFAAKPKFSGFDVKGILMTPGSVDLGGPIFAGLTDTRLMNADGYTRWWNPTEFTKAGVFGYTPGNLAIGATSKLTATVNPYKLFCDRLGATDSLALVVAEPMDSDYGRAVFTAGASNTRRYLIQFEMNPGPQIAFGYAVDCSWSPPNPNPPVNVPDDFPIEANQPEAYAIDIKTDFNALYRTGGGFTGGAAQFTIDVYDWQGQKNGDFDPELGDIVFYSPALFPGSMTASLVEQTALKATYRFSISDVTPEAGPLQFFCGAKTKGFTYDQGPAPAPAGTLTAWQVTTIDVQQPECVADSNNSVAEAVELTSGNGIVDGLCYDSDPADYYKFTVPFGYEFGGSIRVYSNLYQNKLTIYDENGLVIFSTEPDGWLTIDKQTTSFTSGTYYIKIEVIWGGDMPGLYAIYPEFEFTPFTITSATEVTPPNLSLDANWLCPFGAGMLLLANNQFAWVYDVTDPENPTFLSRMDIISDSYPAFAYPYLYYYHAVSSEQTDVRKIDYTDPANPVDSIANSHFGTITFDCIATSIKYLFLAFTEPDDESGVLIFDHASNPGSLQLVGQVIGYADSPVMSMDVAREAYPEMSLILCTADRLAAFNIWDAANPVFKDEIDNFGVSNTFMTTQHQYVIKTDHVFFSDSDFARVFEYTTGQTFQVKDYIELNYPPSCLEAYTNYFYVGDASQINNFVTTYDYTVPTDIKSVDAAVGPSTPICMSHTGVSLFVMRKHMYPRRASISTDAPPVFDPERFENVDYPVASVVLGKWIYLGCHSDYVNQYAVIDISDAPNAIVTSSRGHSSEFTMFCGNSRIFACRRGTEQIYCQSPNGQYFTGQWTGNLPQEISGIGVSDQYMYVSLKTSPVFKVYFIGSYPDVDPQELPDVACVAELTNLIVQGEAMYGFTSTQMYIYDLQNPQVPQWASTYPVTNVRDRLIFGDWLYLVLPDTLWVMDISDPLNPTFVTAVGVSINNLTCITRLEQYLFVCSADRHPKVIDITDPASPVVSLSPINGTPEWPIRNLNASSGHLYELCDSIGVRIYELN